MRPALMIVLLSCALHAQKSTIPVGKSPFEGIDLKMKPIVSALSVPHFHLTAGSCKDQPDKIYTKSGNTYYACVGGQHWCSQEKGKITSAMISEYEAHMAEFRAHMDEYKKGAPERAARRDRIQSDMLARRTQRSSSAAALAIEAPIEAAPAAAPPAVTAAQLAEVTVGTSKADVLRILGQPFSKISGEYESLTYLLDNGGSAKFELEGQRVTRVQTNP